MDANGLFFVDHFSSSAKCPQSTEHLCLAAKLSLLLTPSCCWWCRYPGRPLHRSLIEPGQQHPDNAWQPKQPQSWNLPDPTCPADLGSRPVGLSGQLPQKRRL